jgi:hypothetical protein
MMRNGLSVLAGIGLATVLVQAPAQATIPETRCSTGALVACAAVQFSVANAGTTASPDWQVTVYAWNLFGDSHYPTGLSSVITYVGLASNVWDGTFNVASATFNGSPVNWKSAGNDTPSNLGIGLDLGAKVDNGINDGLVGCHQTPAGSQLPTCYSDLTKALKVVFNTFVPETTYDVHHHQHITQVSGAFVLNNTDEGYWEVHGQQFNRTNCSLWWNSNGASTDSLGTGGCGNTSITPEPVSMALVGTGLVGMGLARLRRRRKDGDIESV